MNISELEQLYNTLREKLDTLEGLHHITETLSDGLIVISTRGLITYCNQTALNLLQLQTVQNLPYEQLFDDTFFGFSMSQAINTPETKRRTFLTLNGEREIEVSTSWSREGLALLLHDRTDLAHMERSAQQSDRLSQIGEMAAHLAHEIRNPLGGIEGFASLLKGELEDPEHQKMASSIINGTKTLNSLVTSVLEYAKPLALHFSPIDLVETLKEACNLSGKKARLKTELNAWPYSGDKERLILAFLNLIHNGWEASEQPVLVEFADGKVSFTDEGSGIDDAHLEKIFTPFFTTKSFGTGLGLPEAKKVIEGHGGELNIKTEEGKGTKVEVQL